MAQLISVGSQNSFGTVSVTGRDVILAEADDTTLEGVDTDSFTLVTTGNIFNSPRAAIAAVIEASLTASADIQLGGGVADTVNFGALSIEAINADIKESSSTVFSGLKIENQLTMESIDSITQVEGSSLDVGGLDNVDGDRSDPGDCIRG